MLYEITDQQLNELCYYLTQTPYIYYPQTQTFFTDLYNTGCRPNELLETVRWNYIDDDNIELTVEKQGTIRYFTAAQLSADLLFAVINQIDPYGSLTLRQLTWVEKKILPVPQVQTIEKSAITYIFRYNFIKQLHINGSTDDQIRDIMSWSIDFDPGIYYNQILYTTEELPPLPPIPTEMKYIPLAVFPNPATTTGTGIETLFSYTMPANTMTIDGQRLLIKSFYNFDLAGTNNICRIEFNASPTDYYSTTIAARCSVEIQIIRTSSSTARMVITVVNASQPNVARIEIITGIDFTLAIDINIQGQSLTATDLTAIFATIDLIKEP